MPSVLRSGSYRLFFYSGDKDERRHVHVERETQIAKFWLSPVRLQDSGGLRRVEMRTVERLVGEHVEELLRAWNEFFSA
ncbi:MAG TPA: DUF4160 domain-containing protein [Vicinamibacteria bacterium]|nr:DUF4160 domain-containing protein [Vicinamibacteria bacterium]